MLKKTVFLILALAATQTFSMTAHDLSSYVSDTAITSSIRARMLQAQSFANLKVDVGTVDGIVMISGPVESDAQAAKLIEVATNTDGVKDVDATKLIIAKSTQPLADTIITAKIKGLFARYKLFGSKDAPVTIDVEASNGVVYLSGLADNEKQYRAAIDIAASIRGVDHVESHVRLKVEHKKVEH